MTHALSHALSPHVGFPLSDPMQRKSNRFLEAIAARDKRAGELFYDVILQLSEEVVDALLLQTIAIAQLGSVAQKIVNVCAATSSKASSMLSAKIYKGAPIDDMQQVGNFWQGMLKADGAGQWYLATPIESPLATALDGILTEKGTASAFDPRDREDVANKYEQLVMLIIDRFFMGPAEHVEMGMITRKMLNLGVDGVKQAGQAVIHKVVKKLEPDQLGAYVEHTTRFYMRLP